jgi:hypothetical protein
MTAPLSPVGALAAFNLKDCSLACGIRGGLGCCVPLLAAQWCAEPTLSWAGVIGFWIALADPGMPPRSHDRRTSLPAAPPVASSPSF